MDSEPTPPKDDLERVSEFLSKFVKWLNRPYGKIIGGWFKSPLAPLWVQGIVGIVMMFTIYENMVVIKQNAENQRVEAATRLNPQLECTYITGLDYFGYILLRNIGDADADNVTLEKSVFCVSSNVIREFSPYRRRSLNEVEYPSLDKPNLTPGEIGTAKKWFSPDLQEIVAFWKNYDGDILIRYYVQYERREPTFKHYSGYFYFTLDPAMKNVPDIDDSALKDLYTQEEDPYIIDIIKRLKDTPSQDIHIVVSGGNNQYRESIHGPIGRMHRSFEYPTNSQIEVFGSWAKMQE